MLEVDLDVAIRDLRHDMFLDIALATTQCVM